MLRPVGEPIPVKALTSAEPIPVPERYVPYFYNSGTAALAVAIRTARAARRVQDAIVILPAYGCPDLVSAALYCGVGIRLADTLPGSPFMDPVAVESLIDNDTVAVVGAHFLGLKQDLGPIAETCRRSACCLIEDSAQLFPRGAYARPLGDMVVHSFGRGKPGGALGGGGLYVSEKLLENVPPEGRMLPARVNLNTQLKLAFGLHRLLLGPFFFGILDMVPGLGIGETKFKPLREIAPIGTLRASGAAVSVSHWRRYGSPGGEVIRSVISDCDDFADLTVRFPGSDCRSLLRYPILAKDQHFADLTIQRLRECGIGASRFYGAALPDVDLMPLHLREPVPNAREFAKRLVTLPAHSDVSGRTARAIREALIGIAGGHQQVSSSVDSGFGR